MPVTTRCETILLRAKWAVENQEMVEAYCDYNWNHTMSSLIILRKESQQIIQLYNETENCLRCHILIHFTAHFFDREYFWTKSGMYPGFRTADIGYRWTYRLLGLVQQLNNIKLECLELFESCIDSNQ